MSSDDDGLVINDLQNQMQGKIFVLYQWTLIESGFHFRRYARVTYWKPFGVRRSLWLKFADTTSGKFIWKVIFSSRQITCFQLQYLGTLERVSGVDCLEPGQLYKLPIFYHNTLIFPGEQVPLVIPATFISSEVSENNPEDGCLFGLIFPSMYSKTAPKIYGVTCQMYEKGSHNERELIIKSRACQRFVVTRIHNASFGELLSTFGRNQMYAHVEILPEIILPDPVFGIETNSLSKFRKTSIATTQKLRRFEVGQLPWPGFVYDLYDVEKTITVIRETMLDQEIGSRGL